MATEIKPIEVGDRFETNDSRDAGRVVEVIEALPSRGDADTRAERSERLARSWGSKASEVEEWLRQHETRFRIRTEAHPRNPSAVGNVSNVHEGTLRAKYRVVVGDGALTYAAQDTDGVACEYRVAAVALKVIDAIDHGPEPHVSEEGTR